MSKLMKKSSGIIVAICCVFMLGVNVLTVYGANWYDNDWTVVACPTGTSYTEKEEKEDTSKVYIKNYADSPASVCVSIYGWNKILGEGNCTYNSAYSYKKTPFEIAAGQRKYCSSTVYEDYDINSSSNPAYAYLGITAYYSGTYHGLWSPDNLNGY